MPEGFTLNDLEENSGWEGERKVLGVCGVYITVETGGSDDSEGIAWASLDEKGRTTQPHVIELVI